MARLVKKKSSIYSYLHSTKVLEGTDEAAIDRAKKEYWKKYKAEWRRNQRKENAQYIVCLSPAEAKQIGAFAAKHHQSITRFLKTTCLAYIRRAVIFPDAVALGAIRQALTLNYSALQKLADGSQMSGEIGLSLQRQMLELEATVLSQLQRPRTIEQDVVDAIQTNPAYKDILLNLLQNHRQ